mmetsp:Transcript_50174/g.144272  ORF Transcript_50174/g.144272 Transcript_50174/m.144272 type:complete len:429 (-) Transcript_50174:44-1330(-)
MGADHSQMDRAERRHWEGSHTLNIDTNLKSKQCFLISKLQSSLKLCFLDICYYGIPSRHFYITDGSYCIEFGDAALTDRSFRFYASGPKTDEVVVRDFALTDDVKRRLLQVCGARNFSLALRNSEQMAKYIQCGSWISGEMVGSTPLCAAVRPSLDRHHSKVNTPPDELQVKCDLLFPAATIYPEFKNSLSVEFIRRTSTLNPHPKAVNMVILGPTGSGKSSIVNMLFNKKVALVKASPKSVTKHMDIYTGRYRPSTQETSTVPLNVIDSVGFCDSEIDPQQVVDIVKEFIKANVMNLHKVIIVCSNRIEAAQAQAIKSFMTWLKYDRHQPNFVFLYNKAETLDDAEREEAVSQMCDLLGVNYGFNAVWLAPGSSEQTSIRYALPVGFPPRAPLAQVEADLELLHRAVFLFRSDTQCLRVDATECAIL